MDRLGKIGFLLIKGFVIFSHMKILEVETSNISLEFIGPVHFYGPFSAIFIFSIHILRLILFGRFLYNYVQLDDTRININHLNSI